jgi:hypothetical protein
VREHAQYFDSRSLVRRMMNLLTSPPSSFSFASLSSFSLSVASASLPLRIFDSKLRLKSSFGVGKVEEGKVLRQVVLDRSSGEDDSALDIESGESLEGESVCHPSEQAV